MVLNKSILNKNKGQQIDCIVNTMIMAVVIVFFPSDVFYEQCANNKQINTPLYQSISD